MNLIYYVTNHGYGHGVRTAAICNALSPSTKVTFRTRLPEKFFREEMRREFAYAAASFDCGCIQRDSISTAIPETLAAYQTIAAKNRLLLEREVSWCLEQNADVIVSDIAPFAFEVARACGIPSVAATNFTWHDIYAPYVAEFGWFRADLDRMKEQYSMATLLLALAPALRMEYFARRKEILPVGRIGRNRRHEIAEKLGLAPESRFGLIYVGQLGVRGMECQGLTQFAGWEFLGIEPLAGAASNYHVIAKSYFPYKDLVASADCMIGKLGYGAVAEAMLHGSPLIYPPRADFAEFPLLDAAVEAWGGGRRLSLGDFSRLAWSEALAATMQRARPLPADPSGARQAARWIEQVGEGNLP